MAGPLDLADIQGNTLRGYRATHARHFALAVGEPTAVARRAARAFIGDLVGGNERRSPQITTAVEWSEKPVYCLNIGLTYGGLQALGVDDETLEAFPVAFQEGPATRADAPDPDFPSDKGVVGLGDVHDSAPGEWCLGNPHDPQVHMMLSLYTFQEPTAELERISKRLRTRFARAGIKELSACDADALPNEVVHFGYRDGISQPRIRGVPYKGRRVPPDRQPQADVGDFLLGRDYENIYHGNYLGNLPPALGDNATYAAFRILRQDVHGFEKLLERWEKRYGVDKEEIAAKLMGRWRKEPKDVQERRRKTPKDVGDPIGNGTPLTLSPDGSKKINEQSFNNFDYVPTPAHITTFNDVLGRRCPIGAHIRRLNPRSQMVIGMPHSRRLVRRSMPYGPAYEYDPSQPYDGVDRGLIGLFICGDLELQYEFILRVWANMDLATQGLRGSREPIIGAQYEKDGKFVIRTDDSRDPITMTGLPRLVQTRGSVYCLIPGIGGLRFLAALKEQTPASAPHPPAAGARRPTARGSGRSGRRDGKAA